MTCPACREAGRGAQPVEIAQSEGQARAVAQMVVFRCPTCGWEGRYEL